MAYTRLDRSAECNFRFSMVWVEFQNFIDHFVQFLNVLAILILISWWYAREKEKERESERIDSGCYDTYIFNNIPEYRDLVIVLRQTSTRPYESQSVIVREYHIVGILRIGHQRVKKYSRLYFNPPEYLFYVPTSHPTGDPRMDNRWGGSDGGRSGRGRRRRYFMGTSFYCARLLGHLLREACL